MLQERWYGNGARIVRVIAEHTKKLTVQCT